MITPRDVAWDPPNEGDHVAKRDIPFAIGAQVFIDEGRIELTAKPDRFGVSRFKTVGRVAGVAYAVIFSLRGETAYIVSVRRASKGERRWL